MPEKQRQLDEELTQCIAEHFRKEAENDAEEDRRFGKGNNPYNAIPGVKTAADRREKILKAIEALEERARQKAKATGREPGPMDPKTQYNFTDPESRILPDGANRGSCVRAYNCPAMVEEKAQIILAAEATPAPQDQRQRVPMTELTRPDIGFLPREVVSDEGYFSEEAIRAVEKQVVEVDCPPEPGKKAERAACP